MVGRVKLASALIIIWLPILPLAAQSAPPPSPSARDFGRYLWTNFKGLASSDNVSALVGGAAATGGVSLWDEQVQGHFEGRSPGGAGTAGAIIGNPFVIGGVAGSLFLASYRGSNDRFRSMSFALSQGVVLDTSLSFVIKSSTHRLRPNKENYLSFTSGHTSSTVMLATVVSAYYPKWAIPLYAVSGFVSYSRLVKNKHWLSDLAGGATQGFIIGRTVSRGAPAYRAGRVEIAPTVPAGGGVALAVSVPLSKSSR